MIRRAVLILLALLFFGVAQGSSVLYTAPCTTMRVWMDPDPATGEIVKHTSCTLDGDSLRETMTVYLWRLPITGGSYARVDSHRVAPCTPDTFSVGPGHYYLTARNSAGESCATPQVTIMPPILTGVEVEKVQVGPDSLSFDVHGRLIRNSGFGVVRFKRGKK